LAYQPLNVTKIQTEDSLTTVVLSWHRQ